MIRMHSIDFNTWMSIIKYIENNIEDIKQQYNMANIQIPVLPSHPRNLSKYIKPSIIVQKVHTTQSPVGFGGFLGQIFKDDAIQDVYGTEHNITMQIDIVSDNNTICSKLTSIISEGIINNCLFVNHGEIVLRDYTMDEDTPTDMGIIKILPDIDVVSQSKPNDNNDYLAYIRFDANIIQTSIPIQEYVDLSKWMKINGKIII